MQVFISEYGKIALAVITSFFIVSTILMSFLAGWQRAGGVSDSAKTDFSSSEPRRTPPVLYVRDFKVKRGEKVDLGTYISALDFDRRDLSSCVQMAERDANGKPISAYQNMLRENVEKSWGTPGVYRYLVRVQSPVTGKVTEKRLLVLVDYGGMAGSRKNSPCRNEGNYENGD